MFVSLFLRNMQARNTNVKKKYDDNGLVAL